MDNIQSSIEECTQAVEDGKNEIIEILNSRANTKGKAQRFDAMKEQLDIRKAGISQRILSLKTQEEEQQSAIDQAQKEYDTITKAIQETREEGSRLTKEIHAIQETLKQQNTQLERNRRPIIERHPDWNPSAISQNVMMDMETVSAVSWNRRIMFLGSVA